MNVSRIAPRCSASHRMTGYVLNYTDLLDYHPFLSCRDATNCALRPYGIEGCSVSDGATSGAASPCLRCFAARSNMISCVSCNGATLTSRMRMGSERSLFRSPYQVRQTWYECSGLGRGLAGNEERGISNGNLRSVSGSRRPNSVVQLAQN